MLVRPNKGFAKSVEKHNTALTVLCDWIESSVAFSDFELSSTDILDVLMEQDLYVREDFAREMITNVWNELGRRQKWIGDSCGFTINSGWIKSKKDWRQTAAYAFCLLLSLAPQYDWWVKEFGQDYIEQGELFELLTKESLEAHLSKWQVYQTGWTRTNTPGLSQIVTEVANRLGEMLTHTELWAKPGAKEAGLDLLCYREFPDRRVGIPVYLVQCASGGNWDDKLHTPNLGLWRDMITFRNTPQKAFSIPFALSQDELMRACVLAKGTDGLGLFLDRCRLLIGSEDWLSREVNDRIIAWAEPRVKKLLDKSG